MMRLVRWMRQVLPRDTIVVVAVVAVSLLEVTRLWCIWQFGGVDEFQFLILRMMVLSFSAALYGCHRVETFHPSRDAEYRKWLESTPWTPDKPLPMGPLRLAPQDIVVIGVLMLLTRLPDPRALYIPAIFLSAYSISIAYTCWLTGQKIYAYFLGMALGMVIFTSLRPISAFVAAVSAVMITPRAIRASLSAFPWELPWFADGRPAQQIVEAKNQELLGWPVDLFAPKTPKPWIEIVDGVGISAVVTWWFVALYAQGNESVRRALLCPYMMLPLVNLFRFGTYWNNHRPPISLLGRLTTVRPWQSGYDHIVIAPFLSGVIGMIGAVFIERAQSRAPIGGMFLPDWLEVLIAAAFLFTTLLITLVAGPGLEKWRLSGRHRIVFQQSNNANGLGSSPTSKEFIQTA